MKSLWIITALLASAVAPTVAQAQREGCRIWNGQRICPPGRSGRAVVPNAFDPHAPIAGQHPAPPVVNAPPAGTSQCRHYGHSVRCPPGATE